MRKSIEIALDARNPELYSAALSLGKELDPLLDEYQSRWDRGDRFDFSGVSPMDMFTDAAWERDPANEEADLTACLQQLSDALKGRLLARWAKQYSREQMVAMVNMLGAMDYSGSLQMWGVTIQYDEIIKGWNSAHPDDEPMHRTPAEI